MADPKTDGKVDLWGPAFEDDSQESAPVVLLRQQADALTDRTGGRVAGVVLKQADRGTVWASLYAKVPALQDYMYKLLSVAHPVAADPGDPSPLSVHDSFGGDDYVEILGMDEFRRWLEKVLSSDAAHAVIVNLLRYSPDRAAS